MLSSRVEEKDLISCGGKSRINPIVSLRSSSFPVPITGSVTRKRFPTFVPRVAKSLFSARTPFFVSPLSKEDFPTLVYPTIPTVGIPFFLRASRWSILILAYSVSFFSILKILSLRCLLILSVLLSPSPLIAPHQPEEAEPPCLESSIPIP